ncbi:putative flippase GtrA [Duganella sp. 1224]|uniref:GtrA family protein n=1 Tax=Duganella sp. 1224 TaxID=2587052 RepID=UPI0015CB6E7F|nr:GtrA family protein [Duganella sp. 1224]NYE61686.1 putative flippase GtrA [Duganella sp. 1224]
MRAVPPNLRAFLGFLLLSGLGWLCDMLTYTALVRLAGVAPFAANVVSSYVGVSFVWFTSLGTVFRRSGAGSGRFLLLYWGYQFLSIMAYSQLLQLTAAAVASHAGVPALHSALAAKIIVTPFNLVTNFLFMKVLTRHMRAA